MEASILYKKFLECKMIVSTDTRKITSGGLYFALKGDNFDGNDYAEKALELGAKYAVVSRKSLSLVPNCIYVPDTLIALQQLALHHRNTLNTPIIAITGSNGKTTTKELIYSVLSQGYRTACTEGNMNNHIGIPLTLLRILPTHQLAIVEMGANHCGEIASYCQYTRPNFGLITNFGKAHLEGFGGEDGVVRGKSELYEYLAQNRCKAFVNLDDFKLTQKANELGLEIIGYSTQNQEAFAYAQPLKSYQTLAIKLNGEEIHSSLTGQYNIPNIMAAVVVGKFFEIPPEKIKMGIETYHATNNRSQLKKIDTNLWILDAYNANPSSMQLAIDNLAEFEGEKIAILGSMKEMGEFAEKEHLDIANLAIRKGIDKILLVGEEFENSAKQLKIDYVPNSVSAKQWLETLNPTNATILLKGSRAAALEKVLLP